MHNKKGCIIFNSNVQKRDLLWVQKREVVIVSWQVQQSRNHAELENQKSVRRKRHGGTRFSNESVMGGTFFE